MTLKAAMGIDYSYMGALQLALADYNAVEGRKQYHETLVKEDDSTTCVTIIYSTVENTVVEAPPEKFEYIGHTGIDPNDPEWESKWKEKQAAIGTDRPVEVINVEDIVSDGGHTITADTILSVELDVNRAQEGP